MTYPMIAAALGKWAYSHAPAVGYSDDLETVSITRYPPALASAISKAEATLTEAPLAFSSGAACHRAPAERVDALADL
jgi:hypothetical protein